MKIADSVGQRRTADEKYMQQMTPLWIVDGVTWRTLHLKTSWSAYLFMFQ
jgi:hypothetical protein